MAKLLADLQTIKAGSDATSAEKQAFVSDLELLATSTTKPSPATVIQLADDLTNAFAAGAFTAASRSQLLEDVDAVFNGAGLSTAQAAQFIANAKAILAASGITAADARLIGSDLAAVVAGVQVDFLVTNAAFPLSAAAFAGRGSGQAQLTATIGNDGKMTATLSVEVLGLTTGVYTVAATTGSSTAAVTLGSLRIYGFPGVAGVGAAAFGDLSSDPFPDGFDPGDLTTVTITDSAGAVQLRGGVTKATRLTRLGNFRLVPGAADPAALGNAAFEISTKAALEHRQFLLYAWKLPASAALTLKVNGSAVGTVTTDAKGRLLIDAGKVVLPVNADGAPLLAPSPLPAAANLSTLEFLELDDAQGQVVATAGFPS